MTKFTKSLTQFHEKPMYVKLKNLLASISLMLTLPLVANAFVPEDLEKTKNEKKCPGCDLRNANLSGLNLVEASLEGANLMGANLSGTKLNDAVLDDASLENANLSNAILHGASLDHATIDGVNFTGTDLQDVTWIDGRVCKKGSIGACN